jgi:hypothetical protein
MGERTARAFLTFCAWIAIPASQWASPITPIVVESSELASVIKPDGTGLHLLTFVPAKPVPDSIDIELPQQALLRSAAMAHWWINPPG